MADCSHSIKSWTLRALLGSCLRFRLSFPFPSVSLKRICNAINVNGSECWISDCTAARWKQLQQEKAELEKSFERKLRELQEQQDCELEALEEELRTRHASDTDHLRAEHQSQVEELRTQQQEQVCLFLHMFFTFLHFKIVQMSFSITCRQVKHLSRFHTSIKEHGSPAFK